MRWLGVATMTRAHGGLAAEMKALANNLQRRRGGESRDLSLPPVPGRRPSVTPGTSRAPRATATSRGAMGRVLLRPGPSVCSREPQGERREEVPGEGAWWDARCTAGAPAPGWGEPESLDVLVDMLPISASLSLGTGRASGVAARSQRPRRPQPVPLRTLVPRPWPR